MPVFVTVGDCGLTGAAGEGVAGGTIGLDPTGVTGVAPVRPVGPSAAQVIQGPPV